MRIGIDATPLPDRPVGAGVYIMHLIRALAQLADAPELVVFAYPAGRALIEAEQPLPKIEWQMIAPADAAKRLLWEQFVLPGLARRARLDLLHSLHYTRPLFLPCASVVTFHDLTFFLFPHLHTPLKRLLFPLFMRLSARRAGVITTVSESTRRDTLRILGVAPERVIATPLGMSPEFRVIRDAAALAAVRVRYLLPPEFLLYVGLVEPRKNLPLLLQAYADLRRQGPTPPLVIVGRMGWMYDQVFEQVARLELDQVVQFAGYVPADDLPLVYNLAQVFVYPSLYEGFGLPPVEALACGLPVVTTAISSMLDNVADAGLLTPPNDAPALTDALRRLLDDPALRQTLAQRGPLQAAQFTWQRTAQETLKAYRLALETA